MVFSPQDTPANITLQPIRSSASPTVPFFPITYRYHICHSSPHTQLVFLSYMVFECCHNIRNQPVSAAVPSPNSFCHITMIRKHQHLGKIFFLMFFKTVLHTAKHSTDTPSTGFHSYSQELVYMCRCNMFLCSLVTKEF